MIQSTNVRIFYDFYDMISMILGPFGSSGLVWRACSASCSCSSYECLIDFIVFGERARTNGLDKSTQSSGFGLFLADNSSRTRESVDLDVAVGFTFEAL